MKPLNLLPHISFIIMMALSFKPRHGYEIMQQVSEDSLGNIKLGPGALYGTLKKLTVDTLIEEIPSLEANDRRKYYRLTKKGLIRLTAEMAYYEHAVQLAHDRHVIYADSDVPNILFAPPNESKKL